MRSILKVYTYECDAQTYDFSCDALEEVQRGDAIPAYPGALFPNLDGKVLTAKDADVVMYRRFGWSVKGGVHLCPEHHPDNEEDEE